MALDAARVQVPSRKTMSACLHALQAALQTVPNCVMPAASIRDPPGNQHAGPNRGNLCKISCQDNSTTTKTATCHSICNRLRNTLPA